MFCSSTLEFTHESGSPRPPRSTPSAVWSQIRATRVFNRQSVSSSPGSQILMAMNSVVAVSECGARNVLRLGKAATALTQTGISPSIGASRGLPETPARKTYINVTLVTFTGCLEAVYDYLEVIRAENQRA
ncbi:hypothetical protein L596_024502 [Steinernema carpocapsae]|uniref:Uncharacterized protein n=1 Tax=Steinernema carpocapsae TaxID=34508 RepID=A0A4U5MGY7_STECR|nr:hypothetical protein L596_024502 [Steinernema carpocapsae]